MTGEALDKNELSTRLRAVQDYVLDCERRVSKGEIMDLQGLDNNVIQICEALTKLPKPDAKELEPRLGMLIESLDRLAAGMKEQQEKFSTGGTH